MRHTSDSKHQVPWVDPLQFLVSTGVSSQLHDLGSEVLQDPGLVDGGESSDLLLALAHLLLQLTMDGVDVELQPGFVALGEDAAMDPRGLANSQILGLGACTRRDFWPIPWLKPVRYLGSSFVTPMQSC